MRKEKMMVKKKKKLTLLIFDATGTPVRQAAIPRLVFPMGVLLLMGAAIALYLGISDYLRLKNENKSIHHLRANLQTQVELADHQQNQIAAFTQKIEQLKVQLANLHEFEKKIRIIANLDPKDSGSNMFGVGGPDPEEIEPINLVKQDYQNLIRDMHDEINEIDYASYDQQNAFSSIFSQLEGKRNLLAATPSIRPVKGWITSRFGRRESPFTGRREFHRGLDIATHAGTPIIAPADGIVTYSARKGLMGNMITIEHGFGMVTRYGHTQKLLKKRGERVKRGETIALVGNTGRSTGPHLHYEVRLNGVAVNPMNYFLN
jgi:murein DD-endopeptidase MepM/ murein hydrolase activator NlpD